MTTTQPTDPTAAATPVRHARPKRRRDAHWAAQRSRGSDVRRELTAELGRRGVAESGQFRELTNLLSEGTFGMDVQSLRRFKRLDGDADRRANLRDHMTDLELALTLLGETTATILLRRRRAEGYDEVRAAVADAADVAASARRAVAAKLGRRVAADQA